MFCSHFRNADVTQKKFPWKNESISVIIPLIVSHLIKKSFNSTYSKEYEMYETKKKSKCNAISNYYDCKTDDVLCQ